MGVPDRSDVGWRRLPLLSWSRDASVGPRRGSWSANLDNRSFRLNFELVAIAFDRPFATELAAAFEADLKGARALSPRAARASVWTRLGEAGARLLSPLL